LVLGKEHYLITAKAKDKVIDFVLNMIKTKQEDVTTE
jgi:hypothetical protein